MHVMLCDFWALQLLFHCLGIQSSYKETQMRLLNQEKLHGKEKRDLVRPKQLQPPSWGTSHVMKSSCMFQSQLSPHLNVPQEWPQTITSGDHPVKISQPTESWAIIVCCCSKLLSFVVAFYSITDNWNLKEKVFWGKKKLTSSGSRV